MIQRGSQGRLLGHLCGVVGSMIAIDGIFGKFAPSYVPLFPYGDGGFLISVFMVVLGARVVNENLPRRYRRPWWR